MLWNTNTLKKDISHIKWLDCQELITWVSTSMAVKFWPRVSVFSHTTQTPVWQSHLILTKSLIQRTLIPLVNYNRKDQYHHFIQKRLLTLFSSITITSFNRLPACDDILIFLCDFAWRGWTSSQAFSITRNTHSHL